MGQSEAKDFYNQGEELRKQQKYEQAIGWQFIWWMLSINSYNKAISLDDNYFNAWFQKGWCENKLQQYEQAVKSYQKATQIKPNDDSAWNNKGIALKKLGRYEEAIEAYNKAIQIKPNDYAAWCNKGSALDDLGRYEEAIEALFLIIIINLL